MIFEVFEAKIIIMCLAIEIIHFMFCFFTGTLVYSRTSCKVNLSKGRNVHTESSLDTPNDWHIAVVHYYGDST